MSKNRIPTTRKDTSTKARFAKRTKEGKQRPGVGIFEGIPYESFNELYFLYWVKDLKEAGFISGIERAPSYVLTEGYTHTYTESNKRGTQAKAKTQCLMRPSVYTPEFIIYWTHQYKNFVWNLGENCKFDKVFIGEKGSGSVCTWIEVKPSGFDHQNSTRLFINNQKFLFKVHNIYVNLVKVQELFEKTFTPKAYLVTATGKPRKINFKIKTLNEYLTQ